MRIRGQFERNKQNVKENTDSMTCFKQCDMSYPQMSDYCCTRPGSHQMPMKYNVYKPVNNWKCIQCGKGVQNVTLLFIGCQSSFAQKNTSAAMIKCVCIFLDSYAVNASAGACLLDAHCNFFFRGLNPFKMQIVRAVYSQLYFILFVSPLYVAPCG